MLASSYNNIALHLLRSSAKKKMSPEQLFSKHIICGHGKCTNQRSSSSTPSHVQGLNVAWQCVYMYNISRRSGGFNQPLFAWHEFLSITFSLKALIQRGKGQEHIELDPSLSRCLTVNKTYTFVSIGQ